MLFLMTGPLLALCSYRDLRGRSPHARRMSALFAIGSIGAGMFSLLRGLAVFLAAASAFY